ncbi:MAG: DNA/RNA non-specific endonuclease [Bacteroidetes bacterium]|nr:DNA/RNA non-specific endonuclease [Bacteroidota bacterium]
MRTLQIILIFIVLGLIGPTGKLTGSDYHRKAVSTSTQTKYSFQTRTDPEHGKIAGLEIPGIKPNENIVHHMAYSLSYNEAFEQPNWVAYELTSEETQGNVKRTNKFAVDPLVSTGTADKADYARSGFDTGHLAPAADMSWSPIAMKECFYYSNMSPQRPGFNRGIWKQGEELVRNWAKEYGSIYIVTGPILSKGLPTIGHDHVAIPVYFYKVILDYQPNRIEGIGLVMKNESSKMPLQSFAVSIDNVEKMTGIDFFPLLPDDIENKVEGQLDIKAWTW